MDCFINLKSEPEEKIVVYDEKKYNLEILNEIFLNYDFKNLILEKI